ncbi:hypothetical protein ACJX0J_017162, partial [Zea mays]
ASIDKTINNRTAPYVFKINGVVHHRIGTLLPQRGTQPKFAQLYTYDTEHETQNRLGMFETDDGAGGHPDPEIASSLLDMLNENNSLVKAFRYARERLEREGDQKITLRLLGCNTRHDVQYNLPSNGEIAAIIVGDYTTGEHTYFGADDVGSSKRKYVMMLEFMGDVLIPELQRGNTSVTICARVSRLWDFCDPQDEAKLLHCDMVLLDEEGNGIHAAIFPPVIQKFKPLIKEGVVYNITYFRVRASNNLYKPVFNENMITFTNWTKLEEVVEVPPAFPVLTYSLTPIDQLHLCVDHREYYTGVSLIPFQYSLIGSNTYAIGIVTSISAVAPHQSRGQHTTSSKRTISLCSVRYKLLLTAGDETGDTDFILFGRMAQHIIKKSCDMLIANNPTGFIPNPITDLLEKTYVWNVSFSDHTINTGNICFQVNAVVAEIGTAKDSIQSSSSGPKQSQTVLLQGVPSGIEDTPDKASNLVMLSTPLTPQSSPTSVQDK